MAKATPKSQKVRVGSVTLNVTPWRHPSGREYWRFYWYDSNGKRKFGTRASKKDALEAARQQAKTIHNGSLDLATLDEEQQRLCRAFLELNPSWDTIKQLQEKSLLKERTVAEIFASYVEAKRANAGDSPHHVNTIRKRVGSLLGTFAAREISSVRTSELDDWLTSKNWAPSTRKKTRSAIISFFNWCQDQDALPQGKNAAQKMATPIVAKTQPTTYSPEEINLMLESVQKLYLPWFVLSAFAGIRREELYPDTRSKKEGLQWEHFRWDEKLIILPPKVSKTGQKRTIPICDLLLNLLAPFQSASGRCCVGKPPEKTNHGKISETARLGGLIGGWKSNALRHSFVSYRCALVGPGIAALEAGNSEAMTRSTYLDSKSKSEAENYFGVEHFENTLETKS